jgi:hypothetical protein
MDALISNLVSSAHIACENCTRPHCWPGSGLLVGMSNVDEWYAFCCHDGSTCYSHRSDNFIISFTPLVQAAAPIGFVVDSFHLRGGKDPHTIVVSSLRMDQGETMDCRRLCDLKHDKRRIAHSSSNTILVGSVRRHSITRDKRIWYLQMRVMIRLPTTTLQVRTGINELTAQSSAG